MGKSRLITLAIGLLAGVAYAFVVMLLITAAHKNVSITYIFSLPIILGAIPVLLSTKEQLKSYKSYLLMPWGITLTFFFLCYIMRFDGMICLVVIVAPFLVLGTLGAFVYRLFKLKAKGKGTSLYASLLIPLIVFIMEENIQPTNEFHTVVNRIEVESDRNNVWKNIKNIEFIKGEEIEPHFIHLIGIPKPLNGSLDKESVGGIRTIVWEKGIKFEEKITTWNEGYGFSYNINVDSNSIPPTTLDEHVMIGGKYFDVVSGSYRIVPQETNRCLVELSCTYRVTTNFNFYGKVWADYIISDFNTMILEVVRNRSEQKEQQ
jgi:hypothetical protein|tara:strand:- start:469 stop:1425 length:957 start_codon:yes stop_codon:yes gene_type:complete